MGRFELEGLIFQISFKLWRDFKDKNKKLYHFGCVEVSPLMGWDLGAFSFGLKEWVLNSIEKGFFEAKSCVYDRLQVNFMIWMREPRRIEKMKCCYHYLVKKVLLKLIID